MTLNISVNDMAAKAADWLVDANTVNRETALQRKTTNIQIITFNTAVVALIASVALALIGVISMQAAFVLGVASFFIQQVVRTALYEKFPYDGYVYDETVREADRPAAADKADGESVLAKHYLKVKDHADWVRVALRVFNHDVWMNMLPSEPEAQRNAAQAPNSSRRV